MGNKLESTLYEAIKADNATKVKRILTEHRQLLNSYINHSKDYTPIMCSAFFNSINSFNLLLELLASTKLKQANKGNSLSHIAAERNNLKILKEIFGKGICEVNELNAFEMNVLDCAVSYRAYEVAFFLVKSKGMELKDEEHYLQFIKVLNIEMFNLPLFLQSLKDSIPFSETPSFLISVREKQTMIKQGKDIYKDFISATKPYLLESILKDNFISNQAKEKTKKNDLLLLKSHSPNKETRLD